MKEKINYIKNDHEYLKFVDLFKKNYPNIQNIEESINYKIKYNPFSNSVYENIIVQYCDDNIIGHAIKMPVKYYFEGKIYDCYWGMDFFVDKNSRSSLAGINIPLQVINLKYHFSIGLTKKSLDIHVALKEKLIGYMYKYISIHSYLKAALHFFSKKDKTICIRNASDKISINNKTFLRVKDANEIANISGSYNKDLLEFTREEKFLKWRFFFYKEKYLVYRLSDIDNVTDPQTYFVVRPFIWKGIKSLLLVDYRFSKKNIDDFKYILKALKILSKQLNTALAITGCTYPELFKFLGKAKYKRFGKEMSIVTNFKQFWDDNDKEQDKLFVTYADADADFNYGNYW